MAPPAFSGTRFAAPNALIPTLASGGLQASAAASGQLSVLQALSTHFHKRFPAETDRGADEHTGSWTPRPPQLLPPHVVPSFLTLSLSCPLPCRAGSRSVHFVSPAKLALVLNQHNWLSYQIYAKPRKWIHNSANKSTQKHSLFVAAAHM